MRVVASITQRSFARFVAFDLAAAARRLGWAVHWIDFDALTQQLAGAPRDAWLATLARVTDEVRAFAPDLVLSYGIEAILPPFPEVLPDDPWRLADAAAHRWPASSTTSVHRSTAPSTRPRLRTSSGCSARTSASSAGIGMPLPTSSDSAWRPSTCRWRSTTRCSIRRLPRPLATCRSCSPADRLPSASQRCAASRRQACRCTATTNRAGRPTRCSRLLSRLRAGARPSA